MTPRPSIGSRPAVEATKRERLTRVQIATIIIRDNGRCGCGCGERLVPETMIDEHIKPLAEGGENTLENRAFYNLECAKKKTNCDIVRIRKAERMAGRRGSQWNRRKTKGPTLRSNRKIKGRGFPTKEERERVKRLKKERARND